MIKLYCIFQIFYASKKPPVAVETGTEDSDVAQERAMVQSLPHTQLGSYSLVCRDLTKYYGNFLAVNRLSFGIVNIYDYY